MPFPLLDLPLELRHMIYREVLASRTDDEDKRSKYLNGESSTIHGAIATNFLRTNR